MDDGLYFAAHPAMNRDASVRYPYFLLIYNNRPVYRFRGEMVDRLSESERLEHHDIGPLVSTVSIYKAFPDAQTEMAKI